MPVCCFGDISIVTEDRVEHGNFIMTFNNSSHMPSDVTS